MIEAGIMRSGREEIPIWWEGRAWGRFKRLNLSVNKHGVRRFHERIRPDLPLAHCAAELQKLAATALLAYRLNKKRDGTWYLLCGPNPAFALVARPGFKTNGDTGFVAQTWRLITVVNGHEHW